MSRRNSEEPTFNSDSFLDIVCNLVGIMIILIIVAGLRVSRAPVVQQDEELAPAAPEVAISVEPPPKPAIAGINTAAIAGWLEEAPTAPPEPVAAAPAPPPVKVPPVEEPPADLIARAEELRTQLARYENQKSELQARETAARQQRNNAAAQVRALTDKLTAQQTEAETTGVDAESAARKIQQLESDAAQLKTELAALASRPVASQILKHAVTPLSRQVRQQDELHFRLADNRVSVVPLESLAEALKLRMQRSRDLFLRINRYEGTAGPVDGYVMRYVVEKKMPSAIDELNHGGLYFRIQLEYYELEVTSDAFTESLDQALKPGSRFLNALNRARPGTPLTFWVYPESFELHRALQEYAHSAGFDIAARPLPVGVPIAGSPNGTRSSAQ